jgi:hypothetical protein
MSQSDKSELPPNTTKFNCGLINTASHFASLHRNAQYEICPDGSILYIPGTPVLDQNPELYVDPDGKVNGFFGGGGNRGTRISTEYLGNEKDRFTACTQDLSKVRLFIGVDLPGISKTDDGVSALDQNKPNPYSVGIHTVQLAFNSDSCQGGTPGDKLPWVYGIGDRPRLAVINTSVNSEAPLPTVPPDSPPSAAASTNYPSHGNRESSKDEDDM